MSAYFPSSHLEWTEFTASELAQITGVSPSGQRDWRQRGFLPQARGWALFHAGEIIQVSIRAALRRLGAPHLEIMPGLDQLVGVAQNWAASLPEAVAHEDGLVPAEAHFGEPKQRYCWTAPAWREHTVEFQLAADPSELARQLEEHGGPQGIVLLDLKAIGGEVARKAPHPLWMVRKGPGPDDITNALNSASRGDTDAQSALRAVGIDWRVVEGVPL